MDDVLDLNYLFKVFKKHIVFIILIAIIGGSAAFVVSNFLIEKKYTSEAMLYVENNQQVSDTVNVNDITAAQKLVNTCQILFKSNTMMENIIINLDLPYTKNQLNNMITAQSVNSTEVMSLKVESSDPQEAQIIVNELVRLANIEFARVIKSGSIEVIDYGEVNTSPSYPNVNLITAAGLLIGAVLSYIIVFIKEMFDVVVKHDDDLAKMYNIPVFAEIMDFNAKTKNSKYGYGKYGSYGYGYGYGYGKKQTSDKPAAPVGTEEGLLISDNTPFAITEAYNTARTNIMFSVAPSKFKIVAVTSCNPSEGKSTTCRNLAIAFANAGHSVLLVECDLRKPTMAKAFNLKQGNGLSTILGGFCSVKEAVNANVIENLDIICAGDIPPNPSELLGSPAMKTFLEASAGQYDFVFLDTPPVNVVTDSQLMNDIVAGMIFVIKESSTTHPDIQEAAGKIDLANGKILGFVKTFCFAGKSGRYGKKYSSYKYKYEYKSASAEE
ncbi:MAG: polysaccharide biosynthesis tyrosine autokinase [Oscillospiraceae bacterium]